MQKDYARGCIESYPGLIKFRYFLKFNLKNFNYYIDKGEFPNDLKHTHIVPVYKKNDKCEKENYKPDIVPVYKKNDKCEKENYKPISILSNLSKIYEKLMYNQLYDYLDNIIFPRQCGLQKGYSAQHCLLIMIKKFEEAIDRWDEFGALLTALSKALNHPVLIAKLYNYGMQPLSINMIFSHLKKK